VLRMRPTTLLFAALIPLFSACATEGEIEDTSNVEQLDVALSDSSKVDSFRRGTDKGELQLLYPQTQTLSPTAGYQVYDFVTNRAGWKVKLVLKSAAFWTYLRIESPSGKRWGAIGQTDPNNGASYSILELELAEKGTYKILATSIYNMLYGPRTKGEYTLTADAELPCGSLNNIQCPSYLKCIDVGIADEPGTCVRPETCAIPEDCRNLPHILCVGNWECSGDKTGYGTCGFVCGQ
jgi:hypothetical protein